MANKTKTKKRKGGQTDKELYIQIGLIVVLVLVIGFNLGKVSFGTGGGIGTVSASEIIPAGIPAVYGNDLGVSYNDVSVSNPKLADATIQKLAQYEDMKLSSEEMSRYIKIAGSISCEYCCGAQSIIFSNGERACGCAHSYAMRGLAKYILINHPEMSDEDILSELGKWKVLFFPEIHEQKAQALEANGIDSTNYINLASNLYRGIEQGQTSGGSMVGGC
ncbi:hypothetical protein GW931_00055 [archaeon]|nr:hypothetical protein [archaeon]PJC45352.1 MAG: hypothetical protein CO037_02040 [Candidatus Pacearchaeota archaeon CG_4_9_14_0_2_um_filter_30_8]